MALYINSIHEILSVAGYKNVLFVNFDSVEVRLEADGTEYDAIFTVGYFSEVLKVFWSTDADGLWDDNSEVKTLLVSSVLVCLGGKATSSTLPYPYGVFLQIQSIVIDSTSGPDPDASYRFFELEVPTIFSELQCSCLIFHT